jgi:hypothetical protein
MHSEFVVALRKIGWKKSDFPGANKVLFEEYCEIQRLLKREALRQAKLVREFAYNTLNEIINEEKILEERMKHVQAAIKTTIDRKDSNNYLGDDDLNTLIAQEGEREYYADILNTIEDTKGSLLEFLAAYYPAEVVTNHKLLDLVRKHLPLHNLYRQKIDKLAMNKHFHLDLNSPEQLTQEQQAIQIIGQLNFEKACSIICKGLAGRIPAIAKRIKSQTELKEGDRKTFEQYDSLSSEQIVKKLENEIIARRDRLINSYETIFNKIQESAVDPEFTKGLTKTVVFENVINNREHFITLRQHPSDWNNTDLFADYWAYHMLVQSWRGEINSSNSRIKKIITATSLHDLFYDSRHMSYCVKVLREIDPPVIDESNNPIGLKAAFCLWIFEMKKIGLIQNASRKEYSAALNSYFQRLSMNETMFSKTSKKAELLYQKDFQKKLKKIKDSQSSPQ